MCYISHQHHPENKLIMHQNIPSRAPVHIIPYLMIPTRNVVHTFPAEVDSRKGDKRKSEGDFPYVGHPTRAVFIGTDSSPEFINNDTQSVYTAPYHKCPRRAVP